MKVLLDHCVPRPFAKHLRPHDVSTTRDQGWETLTNGELMSAAARAGFDAMITVDRKIAEQYGELLPPLCVVILHAVSNRMEDLELLAEPLRSELLGGVRPGFITLEP